MDANEIDLLAEAIVRKQAEANAKAAEVAAKAQAEANAKAAEQAERSAKEAAKRRAAEEKARLEEEELTKKINAILGASVGDVFIDPSGAEHRVVGTVAEGIDTVSRDRDGAVVGNWRKGRDVSRLSNWTKKA